MGNQAFKEEKLIEEFETSVIAKPPGLFFCCLYFLIFTEDMFKCSHSVAILEIKGQNVEEEEF